MGAVKKEEGKGRKGKGESGKLSAFCMDKDWDTCMCDDLGKHAVNFVNKSAVSGSPDSPWQVIEQQ